MCSETALTMVPRSGDAIAVMGAEAVIPPHPRRKEPATYDRDLYRARHAIENLFAKLKRAAVLKLATS